MVTHSVNQVVLSNHLCGILVALQSLFCPFQYLILSDLGATHPVLLATLPVPGTISRIILLMSWIAMHSSWLLQSVVLKEMFSQLPTEATLADEFIQKAAQAVLLPCNEARMWFEHLKIIQENRKRGAAKAAATRRAKRVSGSQQSDLWHCGKCGIRYESHTDETELWIACDVCNVWYHSSCEQLSELPNTDKYTCIKCRK